MLLPPFADFLADLGGSLVGVSNGIISMSSCSLIDWFSRLVDSFLSVASGVKGELFIYVI